MFDDPPYSLNFHEKDKEHFSLGNNLFTNFLFYFMLVLLFFPKVFLNDKYQTLKLCVSI